VKLSLSVLSFLVLFNASAVLAVDFTADTGFQYEQWKDDDDRKASQFHIPVTINAEQGKYSVSVLAGYAVTDIDLSDGRSESLSGILDTKLNLSYELTERLPVDLLFGLDFNFPTGTTDFMQEELILIMDPDLISINNFGEGFNVNPTVNAVKVWGDWVGGFGLGYLWRGKYDFSENFPDYDPGDIINATTEVRYYFLPEWNARAFGYYAYYGKDKVGGEEFAQEGSHYMFGVGLNYDRMEWSAGITGRGVFRDKNKLQETAGGLFTEDNNSQGDEWICDVYGTYNVNDDTTLKATLQGLYIGANSYAASSPRFIGSRKKGTLGLGAARKFVQGIEGELLLKGFVMSDEETNFPEPRDSTSYRGFLTMISVKKIF